MRVRLAVVREPVLLLLCAAVVREPARLARIWLSALSFLKLRCKALQA